MGEGAVFKMQSERKRQTTMVLLNQCDLRSDRGLEMHFSEEQRPVGASIAEMFKTRQETETDIPDIAISWGTAVVLWA